VTCSSAFVATSDDSSATSSTVVPRDDAAVIEIDESFDEKNVKTTLVPGSPSPNPTAQEDWESFVSDEYSKSLASTSNNSTKNADNKTNKSLESNGDKIDSKYRFDVDSKYAEQFSNEKRDIEKYLALYHKRSSSGSLPDNMLVHGSSSDTESNDKVTITMANTKIYVKESDDQIDNPEVLDSDLYLQFIKDDLAQMSKKRKIGVFGNEINYNSMEFDNESVTHDDQSESTLRKVSDKRIKDSDASTDHFQNDSQVNLGKISSDQTDKYPINTDSKTNSDVSSWNSINFGFWKVKPQPNSYKVDKRGK